MMKERREKEGERKRDRTCTPGGVGVGSWSRGEIPASGEAPSLMGKSVGTEGKHLRLSEEGEATNLWQMGQNEKTQSFSWLSHLKDFCAWVSHLN